MGDTIVTHKPSLECVEKINTIVNLSIDKAFKAHEEVSILRFENLENNIIRKIQEKKEGDTDFKMRTVQFFLTAVGQGITISATMIAVLKFFK